MRVLVACEYSGRVREAFRAKLRSLTYMGIAKAMADQWG
jgi:hypothetical protein